MVLRVLTFVSVGTNLARLGDDTMQTGHDAQAPDQREGRYVADPASEIAERRRALARAEQALGPRHPAAISAREQLAYAYEDVKLPELSWPLLEQVTRDLDRSVGPLHQRAVAARKNRAPRGRMRSLTADPVGGSKLWRRGVSAGERFGACVGGAEEVPGESGLVVVVRPAEQ
jgi:hypothetical protein